MRLVENPVLVLGGTGMVGHRLVEALVDIGLRVRSTVRRLALAPATAAELVEFDILRDEIATLVDGYGPEDTVVNCTGVIKPYIDDNDATSRLRALTVNAQFPHVIAKLAEQQGFRVIHITTDCVFTGNEGAYREDHVHDATDVYGRSKSLGEVPGDTVLNLRCSVIGPELHSFVSLLHWVLGHSRGDSFPGYTDHNWSGVTTVALSRVIAGIIASDNPLVGTVHVVPGSTATKAELTQLILRAYGRDDVTVVPTATGTPVDRTLETLFADDVARLWKDAGYSDAPTIEQMVHNIAEERQRVGEQR